MASGTSRPGEKTGVVFMSFCSELVWFARISLTAVMEFTDRELLDEFEATTVS